jgi:hypothetical protein
MNHQVFALQLNHQFMILPDKGSIVQVRTSSGSYSMEASVK